MDIEKNGILGIKHLIKYIDTADKSNLDIVLSYSTEIRFWLLFTLYTSNTEELFQEIPEYILKEVFEMHLISECHNKFDIKNKKYYEYGTGIKTTGPVIPYIKQFKIIRNCLAHNAFIINGTEISIDDRNNNYTAIFDIKWFETLTICSLSNNQYTIKKDMQDISLVCYEKESNDTLEKFKNSIKANNILFLRTILKTESVEKINNVFNMNGALTKEKCSFDMIKSALSSRLTERVNGSPYLSKTTKNALTEVEIKNLNLLYGSVMELSLVPINPDNLSIINEPGFEKLQFLDKLQSIIEFIVCENKVKDNAISIKRLLDVLNELENNQEISDFHNFNLRYSRDVLLKTYANIILTGFIQKDNNTLLTEDVLGLFNSVMSFSFRHAKRIYSDIIKFINRSIEDSSKISLTIKEIQNTKKMQSSYENRQEESNSDKPENVFLKKLRNSLIHDNIEFTETKVKVIDKERFIELPFYSKKTGKKEMRTIEPKGEVYECIMPKKEFELMLDYICDLLGVKTTIDKPLIRSKKKLPVDNI
ncbi:MAG: hypothetical protein RSF67_07340 [Clostridia bacterium]